jgi:hypothetical protein
MSSNPFILEDRPFKTWTYNNEKYYENNRYAFFPCNNNLKLIEIINHFIMKEPGSFDPKNVSNFDEAFYDIGQKKKLRDIICIYLNLNVFHKKLIKHVGELNSFVEKLPKYSETLCKEYICEKYDFDTDLSAFLNRGEININKTLTGLGDYLDNLKRKIGDILEKPDPKKLNNFNDNDNGINLPPMMTTQTPVNNIDILKKMSFTELKSLINQICTVVNYKGIFDTKLDDFRNSALKTYNNPHYLFTEAAAKPVTTAAKLGTTAAKPVTTAAKLGITAAKPVIITIDTRTNKITIDLTKSINQGLFMIYYHTYKYITTHLLYNMVQLLIALKHIDRNEDIKKVFNGTKGYSNDKSRTKIIEFLDKVIKAMVGFNLFYSKNMYNLYD